MLAAGQKWSGEKARAEIDRLDRERLGFIRHHYHRDAADPSAYDLVINASTLPLEAAAEVVVSAYRSKFPARRSL
jgi:cytidylate kinase